jgi:Zn-dependent protease
VKGSFKIGNAFGIPVRIHGTFLVLVYVLALFSRDPLMVVGFVALAFGCVLLHELGHSLVARGFGLRVADITLWPLGGIARMSEIPENPRIEGLIAIAGPAVNFALAGLAFLALTVGATFGLADGSRGESFLWIFLAVNLMQGGFNLLPAFPMDGGRLLRSFLARKRDWVHATELAVRVGRYLALALFVLSLAALTNWGASACMMPLVPLFVWFEGTRELFGVRMRHGVSPLGRVFGFGQPAAVPAEPGPAPAREVVVEPPERGVARRPNAWGQPDAPRAGFDEDEIRRLESHRGPLKRPPPEDG